jgi:hypothetical protein
VNCLKQLFFCILAVFCLKNCFCCEVAPERIEISLASRFEKVKTGSVLTRFLDMPFLEEEETKKIIVPPVCLCEPGTRVKINVYSMLYHKHSVDESLDFTRQIVSIINLELPELEIEIDLSKVDLSNIEDDFFSGFRNVTELDISGCSLTHIPESLYGLTELICFYAQNNNLFELSDQIENLKDLRTLDLSNNNFETFPVGICELESLASLFLTNNRLLSVPNEISKLNVLGLLLLSYNEFEEFPNAVCSLGELYGLSLRNNKISSIPPEIQRLEKLEDLCLVENCLTEIPMFVLKLKSLKSLYVWGNRVEFSARFSVYSYSEIFPTTYRGDSYVAVSTANSIISWVLFNKTIGRFS